MCSKEYRKIDENVENFTLAGVAQWLSAATIQPLRFYFCRVTFCESKGHWFNSQSGHMSGLRAKSPVGGMQEAMLFPSLSPSLPLSKQ